VAGTALSLPVAINKSGRLRMLSQRGAKAWLLLVQGVLPERAKSILAQSLASFEQILGELKTLQPGDDIRGLAQTLDQEWRAYRPLLADVRADPKAVWTHSEAVLAAAQALTVAYEKAAGTSSGSSSTCRAVSACCPSAWPRPTCSARWGSIRPRRAACSTRP
jgi:nitrate/nitrite-specific signal transduction histidine kinase